MEETLVVGEVKSLITDSAQTDMSNISGKLPGHLNLPDGSNFPSNSRKSLEWAQIQHTLYITHTYMIST